MTRSASGLPTSLLVEIWSPKDIWVGVGYLSRSEETSWFESVGSYWEADERPILGQIFEENGPGWRPTQRVALPTWFSHLLPEGMLRQAVASAVDVNPQREFFLLWRIGGDDLPGAVRISDVEIEDRQAPPDPTSPEMKADEDVNVIKFSLAGVQLKFSVVETREGLTVPTKGQAGDWIAKLPDPRHGFEGVPEAEYAGLELARASGIRTPDTTLISVDEIESLPDWARGGSGKALLVKRFDRIPGGRVHVEQLAQVLDVPTAVEHAKYLRANFETVGRVTGALCGWESVGEVIDRIVLNVLVGNGDAHTKNWAYSYPDGKHSVLSEVYDIVPTVLFIKNDDLGMKLDGSRSFAEVKAKSFDRLAVESGWSVDESRQRVKEAVDRVIEGWQILKDLLPLDRYEQLTQHRDSVSLLREAR